MGTISDKLTYLNETKGLIKDSINLTGAGITNDTFRSYAQKLKLGLINALNDNGETIFNNLEKVSGKGSNLSLTPTYEAPIGLKGLYGNTSQNGTPTPSSPIPIESVTGEQNVVISNSDSSSSNTYEVNLGKNLIKLDFTSPVSTVSGLTFTHTNSSFTLKGTTTATYTIINMNYILPVISGKTYTFSANVTGTNPSMQITFKGFDSSNNTLFNINANKNVTYKRTVTPSFSGTVTRCQFIIEGLTNNSNYDLNAEIQLETGSTASSYSPYFTPYKLNDEDSIKKSTGKQLFDKDNANILNAIINGTTGDISSFDTCRTAYIQCKPNTTYTVSRIVGTRFIIGTTTNTPTTGMVCNQYIANNTASGLTITTGTNDNYLLVFYYNSGSDTLTEETIKNSIMINEGSTALPYEPYGVVWYIEKQTYSQIIGNVSTTNARTRSNTSTTHTKFYIISVLDYACATSSSIISDYYPTNTGANATDYSNDAICSNTGNYNRHLYFSIPNEIASTIEQFISYINSTGIKVVYQLATPIYEVITNEELINQLESLNNAKSKNGTTNILITSQDLAMLMDVSVIKGDE